MLRHCLTTVAVFLHNLGEILGVPLALTPTKVCSLDLRNVFGKNGDITNF